MPIDEDRHDNESPAQVPDHEKIATAATWAREALNAKENSLLYERIGQTCSEAGEIKLAIEWFEKAKGFPDCHWMVNEWQALAYAQLEDLEYASRMDSASREMEVALATLRSLKANGSLGQDDRDALVRNLKQLASWKDSSELPDQAFALREEILKVNPDEHQTRYRIVKTLYDEQKEKDARNMILGTENPSKFLQEIVGFNDEYMWIIIMLAQTDRAFSDSMVKALQNAIDDAKKDRKIFEQSVLLLYKGILLARNSIDDASLQQAIFCWESCQRLFNSSRYDIQDVCLQALRCAEQYHFQKSIESSASPELITQHFHELLSLTTSTLGTSLSGFQHNAFLASFYVRRGQLEKARKLFRDDMEVALEILSDEDPDNDPYAYKILANILMHTGDDLNALSAWSLLGPDDTYPNEDSAGKDDDDQAAVDNEKEATVSLSKDPSTTPIRQGPLTYFCDGHCDTTWSYANDMYICRYCPDTQFTGDCLEKLKSNKLERYICHPDHSWLHVPLWSDEEALKAGKGRVRVRGALIDGKRIGGEIVDIKDWVDELRKEWGFPPL